MHFHNINFAEEAAVAICGAFPNLLGAGPRCRRACAPDASAPPTPRAGRFLCSVGAAPAPVAAAAAVVLAPRLLNFTPLKSGWVRDRLRWNEGQERHMDCLGVFFSESGLHGDPSLCKPGYLLPGQRPSGSLN